MAVNSNTGMVFSTRSDRLPHDATVEDLLVSWSAELVVRESPASNDVNTEAEEVTALEAVTRQQPVKTQQTEKI
jgi:hypothetical protein